MNVVELIEQLAQYPGDTQVCVQTRDPDFDVELMMDLDDLESISDSRGNRVVLLVMEEI